MKKIKKTGITIIDFANEYNEILETGRRNFRKAMGKKTLKIDTLQYFKLMLVKGHYSKLLQKSITYGDAIEILCNLFKEELKKNEK